ncbi:hypothetical protein HQN84_20720 [Pedobacter steynii]|nr:hypothetical protein [Pedobacter steynii]NQX41286.1 hypothetical protein [Pedobacter steynii]
MQTFLIAVILLETSKWMMKVDARALHAKQFGYIGAAIGLFLMIYNNKKYNGKYNQYRYYWKDETKGTRILKGGYVVLTLLFPIALVIIFGVHWKK